MVKFVKISKKELGMCTELPEHVKKRFRKKRPRFATNAEINAKRWCYIRIYNGPKKHYYSWVYWGLYQ